MSEISGGNLFAIPYQWNTGNPEKNTQLLDHLCDHPMWFASSLSREEIRINAVWMATNPECMKWECWNGGRLAGMLFLSRVTPPVDALFHFTFFGTQSSGVSLFGAKKLVWNFLGFAFEQFKLRRISMEIPEHVPTLIRFCRQKLHFRYESEGNCDRFEKLKPRLRDDSVSMQAAIALHGSRKEGAHFNPKTGNWEDVILLRLTEAEYNARRSSDKTTLGDTNTESSDVDGLKTGTIRTGTGTG
jgi:hypothetical protein